MKVTGSVLPVNEQPAETGSQQRIVGVLQHVLQCDSDARNSSTAELEVAGALPPSLRLAASSRRTATCPPRLTTREVHILRLLADGLTAFAIGRRARISVRTVHKHLENIYHKLGCQDRLSAVNQARDMGLLSEQSGPAATGCAPIPTMK